MGFLDFLDNNNHVLAKIDGGRLLDREHYHRMRSSQQIPAPFQSPLPPQPHDEPQEESPDDLPF